MSRELEDEVDRMLLKKALETLSEREQTIICSDTALAQKTGVSEPKKR